MRRCTGSHDRGVRCTNISYRISRLTLTQEEIKRELSHFCTFLVSYRRKLNEVLSAWHRTQYPVRIAQGNVTRLHESRHPDDEE